MPRAQFRDTVLLRSLNGTLIVPPSGAQASLYDRSTSNPISETIYADSTSAATLANPVPLGADGALNFWLAGERELDVVVASPGYSPLRTTVTTDGASAVLPPSLPLTGGTLSGSLLFSPDNTYDIGDPSHRPRNLYLGNTLYWGSGVNTSWISGVSGVPGDLEMSAGNTGTIKLDSPARFFSPVQMDSTLAVSGVTTLNGHLLWGTDNNRDIGASAANRPRNVYVASDLSVAGNANVGVTATITNIALWGQLAFAPNGPYLYGAATDVLEQRHLTNPQTFRIYNTYTDASNYERLAFRWQSNLMFLYSEAAGTGVARDMYIGSPGAATINFVTNNLGRWSIVSSGGHLYAPSDNTVDIGASGGQRPRTIYTATSVVTPALVVSSPGAFVSGDKYLVIDASGNIHKSAIGPAS